MNCDKFYKSIQEAYHIEDEATVIKIPFENIIEITSEELIFKNDDGKTEKINLVECAKNYDLAQGISPEQRVGNKSESGIQPLWLPTFRTLLPCFRT